jgi:hypothetical protein
VPTGIPQLRRDASPVPGDFDRQIRLDLATENYVIKPLIADLV